MTSNIQKVAVLGTGIMGSQIAAHLANAGIPSLAFDISQDVAEKGILAATKLKPAAFYNPKSVKLITSCNYDEHLPLLKEVDWIIEGVVERLDIKQNLFKKIMPYLKPGVIVSSNTSGLSLKEMSSELPEEFREKFLVTHFFNPPRYMHLLEIIPGDETIPGVIGRIVKYCKNTLGKGIVYAKDTPNFIANRIGIYGMMMTLEIARKMNLRVEEVDALTGPVIGRPRSATCRTADLVGLDTLAHVATTAYDKCPDDEARESFRIPDFLRRMIENQQLGQKTQKGFYQKVGQEILSLNIDTFEYEPQKKVKFDGLRVAKRYHNTAEKIKAVAFNPDKAGKFVWEIMANTLIYAANRIPEIADDILNLDNAMKWGFGWELGPFEIWDAIGPEASLNRMEKEGKKTPAWVKEMHRRGHQTFYQVKNGKRRFYDFYQKEYLDVPESPGVIHLKLEKEKEKVLCGNWSASLIDLNDGVLCAEFHSIAQPVLNPLDPAMFDILQQALEIIPREGYKGLVIASQAANFSVGANLALILELCEKKDWPRIDALSKSFQDIGQKLKYASFPVVAAPFNMTLGGGFEVASAAQRMVASAELYIGAVEVGVGLIPGGGGTLRVLLNFINLLSKKRPGPFPPVQKAFETIAYAKVSNSASHAISLGYVTPRDRLVMNPDHLIYQAKQEVLKMAENFQPLEPNTEIYLPGKGGRMAIESTIDNLLKQGAISEHDRLIGNKLAYVLTGGEKSYYNRPVDEQFILDLEREAFVSLCQEKKSRERMAFMLKTAKPLRN